MLLFSFLITTSNFSFLFVCVIYVALNSKTETRWVNERISKISLTVGAGAGGAMMLSRHGTPSPSSVT